MTARPAPSDRALWLAIGGALFALSAWPLLLVELPPLQDLPNHLASACIAEHLRPRSAPSTPAATPAIGATASRAGS
jgi:hypothetical protein